MVTLRIESLKIPPEVTHLATDWQVSETLNFSKIILSSMEDRNNLTTIHFNTMLDPTKKYYARARVLLDGRGYTVWGNLDVFTSVTYDDFEDIADLPTPVASPILTTDSPADNHMPGLFTIYATGFSILGNANHVATTWIIEDLEGNTLWNRDYDIVNKNQIQVTDILLPSDAIFRIRALFYASSGDVSAVATRTIHTTMINNTDIQIFLNKLKYSDLTVENAFMLPIFDNTEHEVKILYLENGITINVLETTTTTGSITIGANVLVANKSYALLITSKSGVNKAYYIHTYDVGIRP